MNANALVNQNGDFCSHCGHPFIRNCIGFDTLPLVEFQPDPNIPFNEVIALIREEPQKISSSQPPKKKNSSKQKVNNDGWKEDIYGEQQTLSLAAKQIDEDEIDSDPFTNKMMEWLDTQVTPDSY